MSLRSEIRAALDGVAALGNRNYADEAPEEESFPYTTIRIQDDQQPALQGDARTSWWRWRGQVDLWQRSAAEDQAVVDAAVNALDGIRLTSGTGLRLRVASVPRVPEPRSDVVHHAILLSTVRPR